MKSKYLLLSLLILSLSLVLPIQVHATFGACSSHNGVSCAHGMDIDGSVVCNDGWRDSTVSYPDADECKSDGFYTTMIQLCNLAGMNGLDLFDAKYHEILKQIMDTYESGLSPGPTAPTCLGSSQQGLSLVTGQMRDAYKACTELTKVYYDKQNRRIDASLHYEQYTAHDQAQLKALESVGNTCSAKLNGNSAPAELTTPSNGLLSDINGYKYASAIEYVKTNGIVSGYPDGTFKPNNKINRAEFTKIVIGAIGLTGNGTACFKDVHNEWFAGYVCTAKNQVIIEGYADGTFKPTQNITTVEALKITLEAFYDSIPTPLINNTAWWSKYTTFASLLKLMPEEWELADQIVSRGEIAELIYRIIKLKQPKI